MATNSSSSPETPIAKSRPQITLRAHSERVKDIATSLIDAPVLDDRLNTFDIETVDRTRLRDLVGFAAEYHDTGKAHPDWQARCLAGDTPPPHSARSAVYTLAAVRSLDWFDLEKLAVILAVLHHHTPFAAEHMQAETALRQLKLAGEKGDTMVANLESAGYPAVSLNTETVSQLQTHLKFCREQLTASRQPEQYQHLGFLVTVLRAALIQADHYASAQEKNQDTSRPQPLTTADVSLYESLRPFQQQIADSLTDHLVGLAGCGEGKTQTAFQWGKRMIAEDRADRLVFAMPTQVTTNNLLLSITGGGSEEDIAHVGPDNAALYHSAGSAFFEDEATREHWDTSDVMLSERARRWFQNPVTVSTVDHVLSTLVNGYRGATIARGNLLRSAIIFDEIHAYDSQMTGHLLGSLKKLSEYGIPWYVMTATLPPTLRQTDALQPSTTVHSNGQLRYDEPPREPFNIVVDESQLTAERVMEQAQATDARRIMVVVNTVADARDLADTLRDAGEEVIYYSSEFIQAHRRKKEADIRREFSNTDYDDSEPQRFLVSTQVCEISLDLSADLLLTEVAPMDAILQRAGRLHRPGVNPHADECQSLSACRQCRSRTADYTYECRVFAPLDTAKVWYPYAEERDTPQWSLVEQTASVLDDAETYRFDRSLEWITEAYADVGIDYDTSEIQLAMTTDWLYGPRRRIGQDTTTGDESLQLRDISTYRRSVLASEYEGKDSSRWTPEGRWAEFHDCTEARCGVHNEGFNACQRDFQQFLQQFAVDIPQWWLTSDEVAIGPPEPLTDSQGAIPGSEIVDVQYSYDTGVAPK